MAVIKYSALVDQLRGKLNGTVFSRFNSGFNTYKKGQPSRVGSVDQQMLRKSFYQASQLWSAMPELSRQNWNYVASEIPVLNRLGEPAHLSGYAYFMRFWQYKAYTVGGDNGWVFDTLEPAPTFTLLSSPLVAEIIGSRYTIKSLTVTIILTSQAQTWSFVPIYISNPIKTADGNYNNTKYLVGSIYIDQDTPADTELFVHFEDWPLAESWHVYPDHFANVYARSVTSFTGRETPLQSVRIAESLEDPAPPVLDIEIIPNGSGEDVIVWFSSSGGVANISSGYNLVRSSGPLAGTAADYWSEWVMSETFDPSPTPIPANVDTGRPIVQSQVMLIGSGSTPSLYLTPQLEWYDWINTNNPVPTSAQSNYYTFKARIIRKSDGAVSPWGYYTLLATGA